MKYKEIIITNHARKRMTEREINPNQVWATWHNPDRSRYARTKGAWVYYRTLNDKNIEVVAKKNERGEWVVLSVWSTSLQPIKQPQTPLSLFRRFIKFLFG